jgi:hypothetical protein
VHTLLAGVLLLPALAGLAFVAAPRVNYGVGSLLALWSWGIAGCVGLCAVVLVRPRWAWPWHGLAAFVCLLVAASAWLPSPQHGAEYLVKQACLKAPGYGPVSVATLWRRRLTRPSAAVYFQELSRLEVALGRAAGEPSPWADDARLVQAWLLDKMSSAPGLESATRQSLRVKAATARLAFAHARGILDPWTARGELVQSQRRLLDLGSGSDLDAIGAVHMAVGMWLRSDGINEAWSLEAQGHELLRTRLRARSTPPTHPVYVDSVLLSAGRLQQRGQWPQLLEFYDEILSHPWPETFRRRLMQEREQVAGRLTSGDDDPSPVTARGSIP